MTQRERALLDRWRRITRQPGAWPIVGVDLRAKVERAERAAKIADAAMRRMGRMMAGKARGRA